MRIELTTLEARAAWFALQCINEDGEAYTNGRLYQAGLRAAQKILRARQADLLASTRKKRAFRPGSDGDHTPRE